VKAEGAVQPDGGQHESRQAAKITISRSWKRRSARPLIESRGDTVSELLRGESGWTDAKAR